MKHEVITLVGSTRRQFREAYRLVNKELTLQGFVVIPVGVFRDDVPDIEKHRPLLESIHYQKINMADKVVLIDRNAMGTHTRIEIDYSRKIGKPVFVFVNGSLEPLDDT